jgi:subtilisin-like proprotein convertase family protein
LDSVARFDAPVLDRDAVAADDIRRSVDGLPPRYAIPSAVHITPDTHGTWEQPEPTTLLWRLRVNSPGADSINFGFTTFRMPPGGRLSVYAADGSDVIRPFTELDNALHGELWTPPVRSEDVVVEVSIPAASRPQLQLVLGSVNLGYRDFGKPPAEIVTLLSGSCNVDVVCPEGDPWRNEIPSVGVISTGGSTFCTGFMVNNAAQDRRPFFMTANHCGINSGNAASLVVYWNFENSTCRPVGSPSSGGPGDGQLNQFQTGAFFRASYSSSDFTIVELDENPNPAWNVSFSGWSRSSGESPSGVCIHHPNTDEKRITFYSVPTTTTSYNSPSVPGDGTHVHATWSLGVTEPGSSGSPLFDVNHRVIGQLHGGPSACGAGDLSDYYGRFSVSWTGGGSNSTRLSNWLDPGGTGAMFVDTITGGGLNVTPADNVLHIGDVGGPFNNPSTLYTLTNPSSQPLDYSVSLTASFGMLLNGAASPVTGTLAANGGTVQVEVSLGPAVDALAAGIYVENVVFQDITNTLTFNRQHTVEIGQTLFSVTPATNLESGGPIGGPFPGSVIYTVTSQRPTPVTVRVSANGTWVSLNGTSSPLTINLNGTGDSAAVTVGISSAADLLPAGVYSANVLFTNLSGGSGDTSRTVALDVGRLVYPSTDTPLPIADNATISSYIIVTDNLCIGDVNVDVNITHTYIGDLIVELVSPSGTTVRLHDRTGSSTDNIVATFDDEGTPPDGPGELSDFDIESSAGTWTLIVSDNAGGDTGTLNNWALRIAPIAGNCPTPQVFYSFPLDTDPGWTPQGQWQFGHPTGGGSGNHDPINGFTGSNVYGYNLAGDYPDNMATSQYLTTTAIDCSLFARTRMRFYRWLGVELSLYDHAYIQVSSNGTTWSNVWQNPGSTLSDSSWVMQSIDISAVADGQPTVYIRWGMGPTDGSRTYPGWNIDDVEIWGVVTFIDCNNNGITDATDIAQGFSQDCNANGIPDECDIADGTSQDCNTNGIPDECDLADCPPGDPSCQDCNHNNVPDECDIVSGASTDTNGNGVPDACELPVILWNADPLSPDRTPRSLRFTATGTPGQSAIKVTMIDLQNPIPANLPANPPPDFSGFEVGTCGDPGGCARWVGKPGTFLEAQDLPLGMANRAARLQCTPFYYDWITEGLIAVVGAEIAPSSQYSVEAYSAACMGIEATCTIVSAPVAMYTRRSGDVGPNFNPPATSTQPDALDVAAVVNKVKNLPGALVKAISQLQPNLPELNADVNALDIVAVVDAVKQIAYAFSGPCPCPSTVTCGGACGALCVSPNICVKTCVGGDNVGDPCINDTHCPGSPPGTCGNDFCRDRCGRCTP